MSTIAQTRRDFLCLLSAFGMTMIASPTARSWSLWGAESPDALLGTYTMVGSEAIGEMQIVKRGDKYFMQDLKAHSEIEAKPVDKAKLESFFKGLVSADVVALDIGVGVLLKVPIGRRLGSFESKTGYLLLSVRGPIELNKQ